MRQRYKPFLSFPPGTRTRRLGPYTVLDAYAKFLARIGTGDPRFYPADYQPLVADGDENRHMGRWGMIMRRFGSGGGQDE